VENGRKRLIGAVAAVAVAGCMGLLPSSPAHAKQSIADVQKRVDRLYRQAEQASERYDAARVRLKELQGSLTNLQADKSAQDKQLAGVRQQLKASVLSQYEGASTSVAGQVVTASDPEQFLDKLSSLSAYNSMQSSLMSSYSTKVASLDLSASATASRVNTVSQLESQLQSDKASFDKKLAAAKSLLSGLKEQEREAIVSRDDTRLPTTNVPASGRAAAAIAYAMAQVGKAYVYGAAGPSAFDCSGLTMRAWEAAGVSLPHSSAAQYAMGPHVAASDLQPGDLVFYYSPVSHVGMYIGNGMIVNAENPSVGVVVAPLYSMPYVGAVRPG
jgi:peptidoglycan DL-endopeptidase CwlO